ncbi:MAG: polysaccharide biosynthesis/export family protein [Planctomycetaceae bacterium]|nr:polysaccharide biosynthesis/export family protein [Planctomycetaceae bacterium]
MSLLPRSRYGWLLTVLLALASLNGCAAFVPLHGVPAAYVPDEYLGPSRSGKKTINLGLLEQRRPDQYRLAAGDVLSVYVPGVLGSLGVSDQTQVGDVPPINLPQNPADTPTIGYPVTVRDDGTVSLPLVPPISVDGKTLAEAEEAVRHAYTVDRKLLNDERDRVLISLSRRREYSVLVVRQETANELAVGGQPGTVNIGKSKRGTAKLVRLPAYENDVMHALAKADGGADGLPGLDAKNTIYIIRRRDSREATVPLPTPFDDACPTLESMPLLTLPAPSLGSSKTEPADVLTPSQRLPTPTISPSVPTTIPQTSPSRSRVEADTLVPETEAVPRGLTPPMTVPMETPSRPSTTESRPTPAEEATSPAPVVKPQPTTPSTVPQQPSSGSPLWPQPAVPAESLRRTSSGRRSVWGHTSKPIVRGQSPYGWSTGHDSFETAQVNTGYSPSPYTSPYRPAMNQPSFGHSGVSTTMGVPEETSFTTAPQSHWSTPSTLPEPSPAFDEFADPSAIEETLVGGQDDLWRDQMLDFDPTVESPNVIKIPIRLGEGERPAFSEQDIILEDGDIVFIESRETEVYYTGGLLGGGQYTLPRDYDLRILEAISIAQTSQAAQNTATRSIGGVSALNMDVTFSASHVVILRKLPNGTRVPIEVDLYKAVRRPERENIIIQPGDMLILQYTKIEAIGALIERHLLEGAIFTIAAAQLQTNGN